MRSILTIAFRAIAYLTAFAALSIASLSACLAVRFATSWDDPETGTGWLGGRQPRLRPSLFDALNGGHW